MLVFVDESGDPGRKILNQSSRYFVVALAIFDEDEARNSRPAMTIRNLIRYSRHNR